MKKSFARALAFVLTLLMAFGVAPYFAVPVDAAGEEITTTTCASGVMNYFKEDTYYDMSKPIDTPLTYEFEMMAMNDIGGSGVRGGVILGNYGKDKTRCVNVELYTSGKIRFYVNNRDGKVAEIIFSRSVRKNSIQHIAITIDVATKSATLYVNGAFSETKTHENLTNLPTAEDFPYNFRIGGDHRSGNSRHFEGAISSVALFSDIRTAEEIAADANKAKTWSADTDGLVAAYDISCQAPRSLQDFSGNGNTLTYTNGSGMKIENYGGYNVEKKLTASPETIEAWVFLPNYYTTRGGTIFGNNGASSSTPDIAFEIEYDGHPRFFYTTASGTTAIHEFGQVDVRTGSWEHVTIVHDAENGEARCYLNGVLAETLAYTEYKENDNGGKQYPVEPYHPNLNAEYYLLGADRQKNYIQYFKGFLKEVRVYSDIRTAEEIAADYAGSLDKNDKSLLACYQMSQENAYSDIEDISGNGYTAKYSQILFNYAEPIGEYAYSFAVVGDTQTVTQHNPDKLKNIYQWIINNKDKKNIQYVIGLGDITEKGVDPGHKNYNEATGNAQWTVAKEAITMMDGVLPYSLIRGAGHDGVEFFNKYFADHEGYTRNITGYYKEGRVENVYHTFKVGDVNYMILCLDFGAKDDVLEWANEVVAQHHNYRVIVTTHGYMEGDGSLLETGEAYCPSQSYYDKENNDGDDIWNKFVRKHANICMVMCGHMTSNDVVVSKQTGDNGNVVTQILVDPQAIDTSASPKGMVAMLYFSEDGTDVQVEYYSVLTNTWRPKKTFTVSYDDAEHSYTASVTAPTCTADGYTTYTCSCGDTYTDSVVPATGHKYDNDFDADCNNCGEVREVEIPVTVIASGSCGVNITWVLTSDGVLTISGIGEMSDYSSSVSAPWRSNSMNISTVRIEDGVTNVGAYAFFSCTAITELHIGNGVTSIGTYAFNQCSMLTEVEIPDSVTAIGNYAFANCHNLKSATIGSGVETIGNYAFRYCGKLEAVTIPASVTSIRYGAFYRCSALVSVTFEKVNGWMYASSADAEEGTAISAEILSDEGNAATYLTTSYYNRYWIRIDSEQPVTIIDEGTCGVNIAWVLTSDGTLTVSGNGGMEDFFEVTAQPWQKYINQITKLVIGEGVVFIGRAAFYGHTAITEVVLPESLMAIEEYAFFGCTGITSIDVPAKVFYIGSYAFRKSGVTAINFADESGWAFVDGTSVDFSTVNAFTKDATYKQNCLKNVTSEGEVLVNGVFGSKDQFNWTLTDTGVLTINGKGNMPKFNVNTTPWYGYRGAIRSVVIGDGITSVGRCSFHTCRGIVSITLPESIETIAEYAFYNCPNVKSVEIPANVTTIEAFAFRKCKQLTDVTFGISYGWSAGGEKLSATEIIKSGAALVTTICYNEVWTRDVNAEEEVLDPNYVAGGACNSYTKWTLTYIDEARTQMKLTVSGNGIMPSYGTAGAPWYGYLDNIVEIEVQEGVSNIGRCAFYGLKFVTKVTLAEGITSIDAYAFNGCRNLKEIEIPSTVTKIDSTAFGKTGLGCVVHNFVNQICATCGEHEHFVFTLLEDDTYSIKARDIENIPATLILPSTFNGKAVTQIDNSAFAYCKSIERLLIPESITRIEMYAFHGCERISQIIYNATECRNNYDDNIRKIFVGAGTATNGIRVTIGSNVKRIPGYLFSSELEGEIVNVISVEFVEGSVCEEIGFCAFRNCYTLKDINIPDSITYIDTGAFINCESLESITIPVGVTDLPHQVFSNCFNLTDVYYSGSKEQWNKISIGAWNDPLLSARKHYGATSDEYFNFTPLGDEAYSISAKDVNNMPDDVVIPSTYDEKPITRIDDFAFSNCTNLKSIIIPETVTNIGGYAFYNCTELVDVKLSDGLNSIEYNAFNGCSSIVGINLPDSVEYIEFGAFSNCLSLVTIALPDRLTSVSTGVFSYCYNLTSVVMGVNVTEIYGTAFYDCNALLDVYFKGNEEQWLGIRVEDGNDTLLYATLHYAKTFAPTPDEFFEFTLLDDGTYSVKAKDPLKMPSVVVIPSTYNGAPVTAIGEWAFGNLDYDKINITSIIIPDTVTSIGMAAFTGCDGLVSITIPASVTVMEIGILQECDNLRSIYISRTLRAMHDTVVLNCNNLTDIYYEGTESEWSEIGIGEWNTPIDNGTATVHYNSVMTEMFADSEG